MTVFHKIVAGELPAFVILEDDNHLAFLDIFPTHQGQVVVIPKNATTSKFSDVPAEVMQSTLLFSQKAAKLLETKLENILRCEIVIAGFEVDYFHVKLLPIKNVAEVSHKGGIRADDSELEELKKLITR